MKLIFAGAGASKATSPDKYPTTIDFYNMLSAEIRKDELFKAVDSYLVMTKNNPNTTIDIEEILWTMDDLSTEASLFASGNSLLGRFLSQAEVQKVLQSQYDFKTLHKLSKDISERIVKLADKINIKVFDLYSELPTQDELERCWLPLLRGLLKSDEWIEIFTTNYDQIIESTLEIIKQESLSEIKSGRTYGVRSQIDYSLWESFDGKYEALKNGGIYTKLHGSIDWAKSPKATHIGNPTFTGDHARHVLIYPGYKDRKGRSFGHPFNIFHTHLENAVKQASTLIFIGFAFRDEAINKLIKTYVSSEVSVFIINPSDIDLALLPFKTSKIKHIKKGFDIDAITEILAEIDNK